MLHTNVGHYTKPREISGKSTVLLCNHRRPAWVRWFSEHPTTEPPLPRWHYKAGETQRNGTFSALRTPFFCSLFTYYRVWDASSPRSVVTTGRRRRNFAADRRLDPWPRSNTTNSCWSWFYSPSTNAPPSRAPPRNTHPRATNALRYVRGSSCDYRSLLKKTQTKVSSSQRCASKICSPGQKIKNPHNLCRHESSGRSLIGRDGGWSAKICGNAPTYRSADWVCIKYSEDGEDVD